MDRVKLNSVSTILSGFAFKSDEYNKGTIPLIRISNIKDGEITIEDVIYVEENSKYKDFELKNGDILIALSGATTGKMGIYNMNKKSYLNQRVASIRGNEDVSQEYLYRYLFSIKAEILRKAEGAAQPNISAKELGNFQIPLPDLATQKAIAAKLDKADEIRQLNKKLIDQYDALTQSLFLDMFGDPVKNEKGWEVKMLKDLSKKIHSGNTPKGGSDVYVKKGVTFFRSQNVWKNKLIYEDIAFIDEKTHLSMSKSSLLHKDILMTKTGRINTENSSLGRAALYLGKDNEANVNGHVYFIRLKENNVHEFIMYILTSKQYRDLIRSVCVGGIDKRQLNKDHIENFPIIFPPLTLQNEFAERVKAIEAQKALAQQALQQSEDLFSSLLQESFQ